MIQPVETVNVREVVVPIDQHGWNIRTNPDKERDPQRMLRTLNKWLSRWATRNGKWLINEPRLKWDRDLATLKTRFYVKWASCDAPHGEAGRMWAIPSGAKTITYNRLEV